MGPIQCDENALPVISGNEAINTNPHEVNPTTFARIGAEEGKRGRVITLVGREDILLRTPNDFTLLVIVNSFDEPFSRGAIHRGIAAGRIRACHLKVEDGLKRRAVAEICLEVNWLAKLGRIGFLRLNRPTWIELNDYPIGARLRAADHFKAIKIEFPGPL